MLSWHTYAVLLVPGLGPAAMLRSRLLAFASVNLFVGLLALLWLGAWAQAASLWLISHLLCILFSLRRRDE